MKHKALCGTFSTTKDVNARVAQGFKLFPLPRTAYWDDTLTGARVNKEAG